MLSPPNVNEIPPVLVSLTEKPVKVTVVDSIELGFQVTFNVVVAVVEPSDRLEQSLEPKDIDIVAVADLSITCISKGCFKEKLLVALDEVPVPPFTSPGLNAIVALVAIQLPVE